MAKVVANPEEDFNSTQKLMIDKKASTDMDLMLYDDAIERVGGHGVYQKVLFILMALFANYAQQVPYTFGYTSNPIQYECRFGGEDGEWIKECTEETICASRGEGSDFEYRPDTEHKDYQKAFFEQMDMNCWTDEEVSFIAQCYFIGFSLGILFIALPEKFGRRGTMVFFLIPLNVAGMVLGAFSTTYVLKCVGFLLVGISHMKFTTCIVASNEQCDKESRVIPITIMTTLDCSTVASYCILIYFLTNNAMYYFHAFNTVNIIACLITILYISESPRWHIQNGRMEEGIKCLNYIARRNGRPP